MTLPIHAITTYVRTTFHRTILDTAIALTTSYGCPTSHDKGRPLVIPRSTNPLPITISTSVGVYRGPPITDAINTQTVPVCYNVFWEVSLKITNCNKT